MSVIKLSKDNALKWVLTLAISKNKANLFSSKIITKLTGKPAGAPESVSLFKITNEAIWDKVTAKVAQQGHYTSEDLAELQTAGGFNESFGVFDLLYTSEKLKLAMIDSDKILEPQDPNAPEDSGSFGAAPGTDKAKAETSKDKGNKGGKDASKTPPAASTSVGGVNLKAIMGWAKEHQVEGFVGGIVAEFATLSPAPTGTTEMSQEDKDIVEANRKAIPILEAAECTDLALAKLEQITQIEAKYSQGSAMSKKEQAIRALMDSISTVVPNAISAEA